MQPTAVYKPHCPCKTPLVEFWAPTPTRTRSPTLHRQEEVRPEPGRRARFVELRAAGMLLLVPRAPAALVTLHIHTTDQKACVKTVRDSALSPAGNYTYENDTERGEGSGAEATFGQEIGLHQRLQEWMTGMSEKRRSRRPARCCCSN